MAGKPEDISQEPWDAAEACFPGNSWNPLAVERVARAIMAAAAAEREANEAVCVERAERHKAAVSQYPDDEQSRVLCLDSAIEAMDCAAAIRKRGEG